MARTVLVLCALIILAAVFMPGMHGMFDFLGGVALGALGIIGGLLLAACIVILALAGTGLLAAGIIGLVGALLLAIVLPVIAPLLIVIIPVAILIRIIFR